MFDLIIGILENFIEKDKRFSFFSSDEVEYWTGQGYYVIYEMRGKYYQIDNRTQYKSVKKIISIHESYKEAQRNERMFESIACP